RVGDVMRRDIPTVTTGTRFEDAFRIMQECNCPAVPVVDRMKRLVGLLTPENVTELMMVQSAMPQRRGLLKKVLAPPPWPGRTRHIFSPLSRPAGRRATSAKPT